MMANIDTPQFSFPFRLQGNTPVIVEQDTEDEILDCVDVLLRTRRGEKEDEPDWGVTDQTFSEAGIDVELLTREVVSCEPRAESAIIDEDIEDYVQRVTVRVSPGARNG